MSDNTDNRPPATAPVEPSPSEHDMELTRPAVEQIRPIRDRCDALRYALGHGLECPALREAAGEAAAAACGAGHGWGRATGKVEA